MSAHYRDTMLTTTVACVTVVHETHEFLILSSTWQVVSHSPAGLLLQHDLLSISSLQVFLCTAAGSALTGLDVTSMAARFDASLLRCGSCGARDCAPRHRNACKNVIPVQILLRDPELLEIKICLQRATLCFQLCLRCRLFSYSHHNST